MRCRRDIARVYTEKVDYMDGLSLEQKQRKLGSISYADYLTKFCRVTPDALKFFQTFPHDLYGVGIDAVSALSCYGSPDDYESFSYAGFQGLGLPALEKEEPYIFHFPDGNASVARLLVRALIPGAMPGSTMEDVVTTRADYSKLDQKDAGVRLRLNSTAVHVTHVASGGVVRASGGSCERREGSRDHVFARRGVAIGADEELRSGLLQHDDSVYLPRTAGKAERGDGVSGEDAAGLHARRAAELDVRFRNWACARSWRRADTTRTRRWIFR